MVIVFYMVSNNLAHYYFTTMSILKVRKDDNFINFSGSDTLQVKEPCKESLSNYFQKFDKMKQNYRTLHSYFALNQTLCKTTY